MGLGLTEWLVILVIVVLLFGARKLPELAHSMGSSVQAFKKGMKEGAEDTTKDKAKPQDDSTADHGSGSGSGHNGAAH
ncbi:MAG: twin-arginine translocase TatA/TatE family subunit [Planctomycetes bacterium]|nr:twin-arginine translocase TatA/TatE family subunit [Planctomycetota bacterium]